MKKVVMILLAIFIVALLVNVYVIIKYTGEILTTDATAQGEVRLIIGGLAEEEEEEEEAAVAAATAGGGAGTAAPILRDFEVDRTTIKVMVKQEESFKVPVTIKNTEGVSQSFEVSLSQSLKDLILISEYAFALKKGEERTIYLNFVSTNGTEPGVYTGTLFIKTSSKTKKIPIVYSVKSKMVLFDVSLDIPAKYKEILPGEELLLQLTIFNLGEVGKTDIFVDYIIKDFEGNIVVEQSDIVAVETQVSFSKMIKLPSTIKPGDYVAIAQARYDASLGSSSVMFHVIEEEKPIIDFIKNKYFLIALTIIILAVLFVIFLEHERKKMKDVLKIQGREIGKIHKKIKIRKIATREAGGIKRKLRRQLRALEKAHDAGYISKSSYEKGKGRILNLNKKIR